jgi:hypothetical protein
MALLTLEMENMGCGLALLYHFPIISEIVVTSAMFVTEVIVLED